ncbi:hypothetical protein BH10ACT8_BH10ACT8_00600 [soil metagenome]
MVIEVDRLSHELTAQDRCDRCSARAVVETLMLGGGALLWCAHHYAAFETPLRDLHARIVCDVRATV